MQVNEIIYVNGITHEANGKIAYPKNNLMGELNEKLAELAIANKTVLSISIVTPCIGPASTQAVGAFLVVGTN